MTARRVAEMFPPGEFLREELEARSLTVHDMCDNVKLSPWLAEAVLDGRATIKPFLAQRLEAWLGISAQFWLKLQAQWDTWKKG